MAQSAGTWGDRHAATFTHRSAVLAFNPHDDEEHETSDYAAFVISVWACTWSRYFPFQVAGTRKCASRRLRLFWRLYCLLRLCPIVWCGLRAMNDSDSSQFLRKPAAYSQITTLTMSGNDNCIRCTEYLLMCLIFLSLAAGCKRLTHCGDIDTVHISTNHVKRTPAHLAP